MTHVRLGRHSVGGALILLLVGVLSLGALPDLVSAAVNCSAVVDPTVDSDGDGIPDIQECAGVTLTTGAFLPSCPANPANRNACVDPNSDDFFLAIVPASPSLMPSPIPSPGFDPFSFFTQLGLTAHAVDPTLLPVDRTVIATPLVKAIRVTESLDTNGTILGVCNQGTPLGLDGCVVFTQRILNFINSTCDTAGDRTTNRQAVFLQYVLHTIAHETGHTLGGLAAQYNASYGGNHYKTGAGYIMDQSVKYTTGKNSCTFSVFQNWNLTLDPAGVKLK
jgi:hypothetical protein